MKNNQPFFTIITPLYRGEPFLEQAIQSVKDQTFQDFEYLLINDGSPGVSKEEFIAGEDPKYKRKINIDKINPKLQGKHIFNLITNGNSKYKFFEKENGGQASAKNLGLKNAIGEFLIFLDNDDYFDKYHLENIYNELQKNKNHWENTIFDFEERQQFYIKENKQYILPKPSTQQKAKNLTIEKALVHQQVGLTFSTIKRSLIANIKFGKLTKTNEDIVIIYRICLAWQEKAKKINIKTIPIETVYKRLHPNSITEKDMVNGQIQKYKDLKITYRYLIKTYNLNFTQKIVCNLGVWRFSLKPNMYITHKITQKFLSLISKIITCWWI
jgi:glycosyltransferase involved in cell wall biosynthesis